MIYTLCACTNAQSVFIASSTQALKSFFTKTPVRLSLSQPRVVYFKEIGSRMTLNVYCLEKLKEKGGKKKIQYHVEALHEVIGLSFLFHKGE